MVELAVHQEPLHQVYVLLARSASAAERAALHCRNLFHSRLRRPARLVQVTRTLFTGGGDSGGHVRGTEKGRWRVMEEGQIKYGVRTSGCVHSVKLATTTFLLMDSPGSLLHLS